MNATFIILGTLSIIAACSILFTVTGYVLWSRISLSQKVPNTFWWGSSFFIGVALYTVLFGILSTMLSSVKIGLIASLVIMVAVSIFYLPGRFLPLPSRRQLAVFSILACLFILLEGIVALNPLPHSMLDLERREFAFGIGVVSHSYRIENIMAYVVEHDKVPYLNQSTVEATLASIPTVLGLDVPQVAIFWWHIIVGLALALLVWGSVRYFLPWPIAIVPTSFILLGNTAASYYLVELTDVSHTLLFSRSYAIVIGLALFLISLILVHLYLTNRQNHKALPLLFLFALAWSYIGSHFLLMLIAMMIYIGILRRRPALTINVLVTLGAALLIGSWYFGGFLALRAPDADITGVQTVVRQDAPAIEFRTFRTVESEWFVPARFACLNNLLLLSGTTCKVLGKENPSPVLSDQETNSPATESLEDESKGLREHFLIFLSQLKENALLFKVIKFVRSIQISFLLLLGMIMTLWYFKRNELDESVSLVFIYGAPLFLGGWLLSSVVFVYGQYGEVSRFFQPGISVAMFLLGMICVSYLRDKGVVKRTIAVLIILLALIPTTVDRVYVGAIGNFYLPAVQYWRNDQVEEPIEFSDILSIEERLKLFLEPTSVTKR